MKMLFVIMVLCLGVVARAEFVPTTEDVALSNPDFNLSLYRDLAKVIKPTVSGDVSEVTLSGLLACAYTKSNKAAQCSLLKGGWKTTTETGGVGVGVYTLTNPKDCKRIYDSLGTMATTTTENFDQNTIIVSRVKDVKACVANSESMYMTSLSASWVQQQESGKITQDLRLCTAFKDYLQPMDACE